MAGGDEADEARKIFVKERVESFSAQPGAVSIQIFLAHIKRSHWNVKKNTTLSVNCWFLSRLE